MEKVMVVSIKKNGEVEIESYLSGRQCLNSTFDLGKRLGVKIGETLKPSYFEEETVIINHNLSEKLPCG